MLLFKICYLMEITGLPLAVSILSLTMRTSLCVCVSGDDANANILCFGSSSDLGGYTSRGFAVRPVLTLKSDVIDISANYDSENGWKLK